MKDNYAKQWNNSSKFFYDKGYYSWMCEKIDQFSTVLEIGCGVGYGTLSLIQNGHKVISVEKDKELLEMSRSLIQANGVSDQVLFIQGDIIKDSYKEKDFDVVVCWNPGIGSLEGLEEYIPHMIRYGLTLNQIKSNFESSYSEYLIWQIAHIAKSARVPYHLVDRCGAARNVQIEFYYRSVQTEVGFPNIKIDYLEGESLSTAGVPLMIFEKKINRDITPNVLASVLMY